MSDVFPVINIIADFLPIHLLQYLSASISIWGYNFYNYTFITCSIIQICIHYKFICGQCIQVIYEVLNTSVCVVIYNTNMYTYIYSVTYTRGTICLFSPCHGTLEPGRPLQGYVSASPLFTAKLLKLLPLNPVSSPAQTLFHPLNGLISVRDVCGCSILPFLRWFYFILEFRIANNNI